MQSWDDERDRDAGPTHLSRTCARRPASRAGPRNAGRARTAAALCAACIVRAKREFGRPCCRRQLGRSCSAEPRTAVAVYGNQEHANPSARTVEGASLTGDTNTRHRRGCQPTRRRFGRRSGQAVQSPARHDSRRLKPSASAGGARLGSADRSRRGQARTRARRHECQCTAMRVRQGRAERASAGGCPPRVAAIAVRPDSSNENALQETKKSCCKSGTQPGCSRRRALPHTPRDTSSQAAYSRSGHAHVSIIATQSSKTRRRDNDHRYLPTERDRQAELRRRRFTTAQWTRCSDADLGKVSLARAPFERTATSRDPRPAAQWCASALFGLSG